MTDKTPPSLNLIERMARRMADQSAGAGKPAVNGNEVRMPQSASPVREEPRLVVAQPPASESRRTSAVVPEKVPEPVRPVPADGASRLVNLDFRALRQFGMITPDNLSSPISNEFRGVKRRLLQKVRDKQTRAAVNNLVLVTSSLPGEGKTFTSVNLAISLAAERGLQVLLVDGDVVRPSVGNMFKSTPREGLTDLLTGKATRVSDVMCRCADVPNLSVMFAGNPHVNSPELISSGRMADLCVDLSTRYPDRIIVIDTPPVLATPEPATLASYAHHVIMVVAADQTQRWQLRKSLESVSTCKSVSLLFNKAPLWNDAEYTPYYGYGLTQSSETPAASS